jgi:hypothetical protein
VSKNITVYFGTSRTHSGSILKKGEQYLIYANLIDAPFPAENKILYFDSWCTRTRLLSQAIVDTAYLEQQSPKRIGDKLYRYSRWE